MRRSTSNLAPETQYLIPRLLPHNPTRNTIPTIQHHRQ